MSPAIAAALVTALVITGPVRAASLAEISNQDAVRGLKEALVQDGIPFTSFAVDDVVAVHADLQTRGVEFTQAPTAMGPMMTAVLDDTCGNLIQLTSPV